MRFLIATILAALAQPVLAHGEKPYARAFDYSKAEATPFGIAADPATAERTIRVDMSDTMRFTPAQITVRRGEVVRFVAANKGKVLHEMVLGTKEELEKHAELMTKFPGMEHDEPHIAHVAPGRTGEIGWRFTQHGTFYFGCLIPGHFEAGMAGRITVR
ncbi:MAG: cupredoxin family protein [Betaproteobacteria bacterium]|nr:cupredoxin family protein [Betaproteobacteria bacterium]MDH5221306.1 cupredoxin family protein [Betaproteobacteria bacterium]MDH5349910.1 cupredoxin family protein [Betaproteobacteria bacterium]